MRFASKVPSLCAAIAMTFVFTSAARAEFEIAHTPPQVIPGEATALTISAAGIKRARAMVGAATGLKAVPFSTCRGKPEYLCARLPQLGLATVKYWIQAELDSGKFVRTPQFAVRQPSNSELEQRIAVLTKESNQLQEQLEGLDAKLTSVKTLTPQMLQARKGQESAKAYLALNRKERELAELQVQAAQRDQALRAERMQSERGRLVEGLLREMEEEANGYRWGGVK